MLDTRFVPKRGLAAIAGLLVKTGLKNIQSWQNSRRQSYFR